MSDDNIFNFKSEENFYEKEREGIKNNTVREIDLNDNRFLSLIAWMMAGWDDGEILIKITSKYSGEYFVRQIRDISVYGDFMIITWNHGESKNLYPPFRKATTGAGKARSMLDYW